MQSLAGLDTPWIHPATTALGGQKAEEGGREDKLQDPKLLYSNVAKGLWTRLRSRASNRSHGVRQGSRAGVRNILQKEREEGLKSSRSCFHPYLRQNFLKHMHVVLPFRKLTHPLGNFLQTMWQLAKRAPKNALRGRAL